jgi:hypothetical protein
MSRAVFQSTLGGSTTLDAEQTADTKTLVIPAADGTLVYTDDAGVASFDDISLTGAVLAGTWSGSTIAVAKGGTGAVTLTGYVKGAGTTALTASATIPNSDITGLGTMSTQNASAVAITGGTISGLGTPLAVPSGGSGAATLTGYVKGNGTSAMTASATIPNTDITGLGTMSVQNANNVAITGGTISSLGTALAVPSGGTGATTLTGLVYGNGTSAMTAASAAQVVSVIGSTAVTNATNATNAVSATTATNIAGGLSGSVPYQTAAGATSLLPKGTDGQVLSLAAGIPSWISVSGAGTVTSVDGSGGTTGLSLTGGPITASGTLTLGGTLAVANGGTGSTTAANALTALGAYPASNPSGFGTGTVTSVTGTAPVVSSGGNTPAISMAAANTTTDGYLTSTDWNTFNGKGAGTVTSVGGTGTVNGLSLTGTVTTSGNLTLGGTLDLASPPAIGGTTPAAGAFTTLTMNGGAISPQTGFKNRIINGGMTIDQRNGGAAVTINSGANTYTLDRWVATGQATDGVFTVDQVTTAPTGFINSTKITVTTADASIGASQFYLFGQFVEGFNISDLGWGTASASPVTLSFQTRSSLTGTFGGVIHNSDLNRSYPFTYTISAANTWEYKTITIAGDTSGTWLTDSGRGLALRFQIGVGSSGLATAGAWTGTASILGATGATNIISTLNADWYVTGVQLEKGSTATPFEFRSIGTELGLCQRYYQSVSYPRTFVNLAGSNAFYMPVYFIVSMRTAPTVGLPSFLGNVVLNSAEVPVVPGFQWNAANITTNSFSLRGGTSNIGGIVEGTATASAEL